MELDQKKSFVCVVTGLKAFPLELLVDQLSESFPRVYHRFIATHWLCHCNKNLSIVSQLRFGVWDLIEIIKILWIRNISNLWLNGLECFPPTRIDCGFHWCLLVLGNIPCYTINTTQNIGEIFPIFSSGFQRTAIRNISLKTRGRCLVLINSLGLRYLTYL